MHSFQAAGFNKNYDNQMSDMWKGQDDDDNECNVNI